MTTDDVLNLLASELKRPDIRSKQAAFDIHIINIDDLLNNKKVAIKYICCQINKKTELDLKYTTIKTMCSRARSKNNIVELTEKELINPVSPAEKKQIIEANSPTTEHKTTVKNWEEIQVTSEGLIENLNKYSISPEEVKGWNCANELQISKKLTEKYIMKRGKTK